MVSFHFTVQENVSHAIWQIEDFHSLHSDISVYVQLHNFNQLVLQLQPASVKSSALNQGKGLYLEWQDQQVYWLVIIACSDLHSNWRKEQKL